MVSVDDIIRRWKRSDRAWEDHSFFLNPKNTSHVFQVFESPNIHKSGRAMWNMGMWLDTHWHEFDQLTKRRLLKAVESIMLSADHDRAMGLWKLGESLGYHVATKAARRILIKVAEQAKHKEAISNAIHGLVDYARVNPRSRESICLYLLKVVELDKHKEVIISALCGLVVYARVYPKSRESICLHLSRLARRRNRLQYKETIKPIVWLIKRNRPHR